MAKRKARSTYRPSEVYRERYSERAYAGLEAERAERFAAADRVIGNNHNTEPNYRLRVSETETKLRDAERHLRKALDGPIKHPASVHVVEALRHLTEAHSKLRGEL